MADIELVIKIPEELYNNIQKGCGIYPYRLVYEAMRKGTPLPKRHGDLIDRNELLKQPMDIANYPSNYVKIAQSIIEADKSESNNCKAESEE